jgi:hypothetical protein
VVGGLVLLAASVLWTGTGAAEGGAFTATASADGVRTTVTIRNAPLTDSPVDGGGPSAQAQLGSTGTSRAFSSAPYPGDTAINLPGTAAGFGVPGVPSYPSYVESNYPLSPPGSADQGPYHLDAKSGRQQSQAEARAGTADSASGATAGTRSNASTQVADDGSVLAAAKAETQSLTVGVLRLGSVTSAATVRLKTDGNLERTTSLDVTGVSVGGVAVGFGPSGFTIAGTTTPFPNADQLTSLLAAQKTTLSYLQPVKTSSGTVAPALQITTVQNVPGQNPANITLVLGRAVASVEGVAIPKDTPPAVAGVGGSVGGSTPDIAATPGSPGTPALAGAGPVATGALPKTPLAATPITRAVRRQSIDRLGGPSIYLVVAGGGLLALGLAQAMSQLGVRLRWSS